MSGIDKFFMKVFEFLLDVVFRFIKGILEQAFPQFNWGGCLGILIIFMLTIVCCALLTNFF